MSAASTMHDKALLFLHHPSDEKRVAGVGVGFLGSVQCGKRINLLGKIRLAAALFAVNVLYLALRPIIRGFELLFRTEKSIQGERPRFYGSCKFDKGSFVLREQF